VRQKLRLAEQVRQAEEVQAACTLAMSRKRESKLENIFVIIVECRLVRHSLGQKAAVWGTKEQTYFRSGVYII
jgi:hypothetical protein